MRWLAPGAARPALTLLLGAVLGGCATPPAATPRTTVILLPDEDGKVGTVAITTSGGSQALQEAFTASTVASAAAAPSAPFALGREQVDAAYAALLKAQPPRPASFTLHFLLDKTVLTEESKAVLPAMLEAARSRKPTQITIYGHADASGSETRNHRLAAERAKVVAELLHKDDPALGRIEVQSFGDRLPLVPSKSRVAEPRNRRAEVVIL